LAFVSDVGANNVCEAIGRQCVQSTMTTNKVGVKEEDWPRLNKV